MKMFPVRLSDDEYIERLRRGIEQWDRWWYVSIPVALAVVATLGWGIAEGVQKMIAIAQRGNIPNVWTGIIVGGAIGLSVGFVFQMMINGFIAPLLHSYRTERLLLKYYDAVHDAEDVYQGNVE
ncbi:MAG: hypothetical protein WEB58_18955 [Planctomycetaceae bacterium]